MASKSPRQEEAASLATSSRSSATNHSQSKRTYDVFLSFRGEDSRTTFTDHLYLALEDAGVNVFRDTEGLRRGDDISWRLFDVIPGCRVSVVVFSKNYADSSWCLEELAVGFNPDYGPTYTLIGSSDEIPIISLTVTQILSRLCRIGLEDRDPYSSVFDGYRRVSGQLVLPVFYGIDPSDVRKQRGSFMEAFHRHEQRSMSEKDKVARWKAAATEAGNLSGWDLGNAIDRHEGKTIRTIVRTILDELNETQLDLAKYPVGLKPRLEELSSLLEVGTGSDVRFIGISGMGGIGKTTLAKAVYNQFFHSFHGKCFLADVRENFDRVEGQVRLQEQLLSDILKSRKIKLGNIHQGVNVIKARLSRMRVLLVLDDISHSEQLAVLARERDWFGPGSRIVITTRNLDLLKEINAESIYMARELDDEESLQLFCQYAFTDCSPREELIKLLEDMLSYCKGLPLALRVIGSSVLDRSVEEWKSILKMLKEIPHNEIQRQLRISYDALGNDKEKDLFLDIACFFVGFDRDYAVKVLDGCGLFAEIGISVLKRKGLLEINRKNKLKMHNLIRDMGREIVRQKYPTHPEKRSRLWFHEDVLYTLQNHLGTEEVEGIALNSPELRTIKVDAEAFAKMKRLRLLQLDNLHVHGGYGHLPKGLRWLYWHKFPLTFIPKDFSIARLVVIDLQYSNLRELWKDDKFLGHLTVLNLSYSHLLTKSPDFSKLPNLEKLILRDCTKLAGVHSSIGYLERLVSLNLRNCKKLKKIPSSICRLKSLEILDISGCPEIDRLPEDFGYLESLRECLAEGTNITQVPVSITRLKNLTNASFNAYKKLTNGSISSLIRSLVSPRVATRTKNVQLDFLFQLRSLRTLRLAYCGLSDESMPTNCLGSLQLLENLDLSGNQFSGLPDSIKILPRLEKLVLDDCTELKSLPSMPPSLFVLSAVNCVSLESYPFDFDLIDEALLYFKGWRMRDILNDAFERNQLHGARATVHLEWCMRQRSCKDKAQDAVESFILGDDNNYKMRNDFFRRSSIPDWFDYQGTGPSLSFRMFRSQTCRLRGVSICVIYSSDEYMVEALPPPAYRVTIRNRGMSVELTHQTGKGGDGEKIHHDAIFRQGKTSYAWLIHLPHQVVFRDEMSYEGEVELEADSGTSSLCVERMGIHFGTQVCRYCHSDSSTGRKAPADSSAMLMPCEFDFIQVMPNRPRQIATQDNGS